jgi:hypothetical protein
MNNVRELKPKPAAQPTPAEYLIALAVERITVTGIELTEPEVQRFEALLTVELKRRLTEQFAVKDADINAETLRFDLSEIVLSLDQPSDVTQAAREIARRLALTLESAATKGKS